MRGIPSLLARMRSDLHPHRRHFVSAWAGTTAGIDALITFVRRSYPEEIEADSPRFT